MPSEDKNQKKANSDAFADVADEPEENTEGEQEAGDGDDRLSETSKQDTEGRLGDEEAVMSDNEPPKQPGKIKRFFAGYWRKKKWTLPVTALVLIAVIFAIPASRYPLLALKLKRSYSVTIVDSKTNTPVSGATVMLDGKTVVTDSAGKATLTAKVGKRTVNVSKKYYKSFTESIFVGVGSSHNSSKVNLQATGRQLFIKVSNKLTGKPVANAEIKVLGTDAKTDNDGLATIVLPTTSPTQSATVTADGYNTLTEKLQVTNIYLVDAGKAETGTPYLDYALTPSGRVYFLSNLSGNIDVVSTNLDGTNRQTVLAGTGSEDENNTVLLASRDWKYLALLSKRDGGKYAKLFLINTSNNQVTTMDDGTATFTPVGWSNHDFVYEADRADVQDWQPGNKLLNSYNADTGKLTKLDQTTAQGSSEENYVGQTLGYNDTYIVGGNVVYVKIWSHGYPGGTLSGKQDQIWSVAPDGTGKRLLKSIPIPSNATYQAFDSLAYRPTNVYWQVSNDSGETYYVYNNGYVTQSNTITSDTFTQDQQNYATYLESPSGGQTFWSEQRDGKNTLLVGDANGGSGKQIATLSDYAPYGWFTDNYLLVENGGSELAIMPASGGNIAKISDYYKPPRSLYGYGGGYGGL